MPLLSTPDLRFLFYGGGSDAERAFLLSAYNAGQTASYLLTQGMPWADENDLLGRTSDPSVTMGNQVLTAAATAFISRVPLRKQISITNILCALSANAVTPTHAFVQAWRSDGTVIGRSQDYATNWVVGGSTLDGNPTGVGFKTIPLVGGPLTVAPVSTTDFLWVGAYVGTAGTLPGFVRPSGFSIASLNAGCIQARTRSGQFAIADSATPGNLTPASIVQAANLFWFGLN